MSTSTFEGHVDLFEPAEDSRWVMPRDTEKALVFIERAGLEGRPGLCMWRTEPDRALVTDAQRGAYTVFAVPVGANGEVRVYEESGWPV